LLGLVAHTCDPSYERGRRIMSSNQPGLFRAILSQEKEFNLRPVLTSGEFINSVFFIFLFLFYVKKWKKEKRFGSVYKIYVINIPIFKPDFFRAQNLKLFQNFTLVFHRNF
jgi:hypothetical protein